MTPERAYELGYRIFEVSDDVFWDTLSSDEIDLYRQYPRHTATVLIRIPSSKQDHEHYINWPIGLFGTERLSDDEYDLCFQVMRGQQDKIKDLIRVAGDALEEQARQQTQV